MNDFKKRIEKLERLRPKGLASLSDEELDRQIAAFREHPEYADFCKDARVQKLLKTIEEYTANG